VSAAAFFDVDGTLSDTNIVRTTLYLARRAASARERVGWLARIGASLPVLALAELSGERGRVNEIHYATFRGVSEDRLRILSRSLFDELVRPSLYAEANELVQKHAAAGVRVVFVSGALDFIVEPLARHFGVEDFAANQLLFDRSIATGRLRRPILAGAAKAAWVRRYAQRNEIDLARSFAFADDMADVPMLACVGHPAAVNPSATLERIARENRWPTLKLRKGKTRHG
jgi:HAD superfamily hydrolase (TIGR01490 family)